MATAGNDGEAAAGLAGRGREECELAWQVDEAVPPAEPHSGRRSQREERVGEIRSGQPSHAPADIGGRGLRDGAEEGLACTKRGGAET